MSGSDDRVGEPLPSDPLEERLRRRLRVIAGATFLVLIVVLALVDTFGRPAGLQVSELFFGSIMGALLLILGVEVARLGKR